MGYSQRWWRGGAACLVVGLAAAGANALVIGGGGSKSSDCLLALDTAANAPAGRPKNVICTDGDATCDGDGIVNGICEVAVAVCANSTAFAGCTLNGVEDVQVSHADDDGVDPKFDPDFQALQTRIDTQILDEHPNTDADDCTTPSAIRVPIKGPLGANKCGKQAKTLRITTISTNQLGRVYVDKDKLKITCVPAPAMQGGCDPQTLFSGTFDRMQKQIFNQSCAVAVCHDSNSTAGGLLLETGATYTNLVNVDPNNGAALGQGWKRVTAGNAAASFLFHKVTGDLPDATYGGRMPLKRSKLHPSLQAIIQAWIDGGAPATGWVPGTF